MGGLQGQLQQVQLERGTLQNRLKTSQAEIDSLQQLRQWYQQQLALAQEARVRLQGEMANMQVGGRQALHVLWLGSPRKAPLLPVHMDDVLGFHLPIEEYLNNLNHLSSA